MSIFLSKKDWMAKISSLENEAIIFSVYETHKVIHISGWIASYCQDSGEVGAGIAVWTEPDKEARQLPKTLYFEPQKSFHGSEEKIVEYGASASWKRLSFTTL